MFDFTFVYENGEVNVFLITMLSIISILIFFITISIIGVRISNKEEDLVIEEEEVIERSKVVKRNVKKDIIKPSKRISKKINKDIPKIEETPLEPTKIESEIENKAILKPSKEVSIKKEKEDSKIEEVPLEPTKNINKEENVLKVKKNIISKKEITKPISKIEEIPTESAIESTITEKIEEKVENTQKSAIKSTIEDTYIGKVLIPKEIVLNNAEKQMIQSVSNNMNRGHIFQIYNSSIIMDFPIHLPQHINRIERQIETFKDNKRGRYIVYLIWDNKLKCREYLRHKLRYNPNSKA